MRWEFKSFSDLNIHELYAILALRSEVFVVEQDCVYQDADGLDQAAYHLCVWDGAHLAAYLRVLPANTRFRDVSIGRIIVQSKYRGRALGKQIIEKALASINERFGTVPVQISAQCYLANFYAGIGFTVIGEAYDEDGIPHINMVHKDLSP